VGAHTPWHAPPTHVWFVQSAGGVLHCPVAPHVSTPLLTHCLLPTAQLPWHEAVLPLCTHVWFEQGVSVVFHWPLLPHV
jgi:hypothetical protein